jgi:heme-degrading monooxygenase HmoA
MPHILVRHKVQDYAKWRPVYEEHGAARKAAGCKGTQVFRSADDPGEIVILLEWDSIENARRFTQSQDLRDTMMRAGVTDQPSVYFLNDAGRTSS